MAANLSEGTRIVNVDPGGEMHGWCGTVTAVDGDERYVRFDNGAGEWIFTTDLALDAPCDLVDVHGECWCDAHDTATPCVIRTLLGG